ncbi:MAG: helix-turn-helix domain-containing protein [Candidatus Thiothrix putei]|uniref:Helix-turn-helix domain-containing protein n=1 Tax=Candidatus Thiothrix putei TaxID=3080811 RepID=A0AA95KRW5_9GAMM|nr:MAG: helix-turn-helix domain-containing protein [Candidatus Thiothrix putei]
MKNKAEKKSSSQRSSYRQLEDVVGCKWSVSVLQAIAEGISRPGALERHIEGISTKVLGERLRKLTAYGLLSRQVYPEIPPHTEYTITENGKKLALIIAQLQSLDHDIRSTADHKQ